MYRQVGPVAPNYVFISSIGSMYLPMVAPCSLGESMIVSGHKQKEEGTTFVSAAECVRGEVREVQYGTVM